MIEPDYTRDEAENRHPSSVLIAGAARARGHEPTWLTYETFTIDVGGRPAGFAVSRCRAVSLFAHHIAGRKDLTARLLAQGGVPVAESRAFPHGRRAAALSFARELGWPVVVKPAAGSRGAGVALNVDSDVAFVDAWHASPRQRMLVERQFPASDEARFIVVGGNCVSALKKRSPRVVGDGRSTVGQLVEAKNRQRTENVFMRSRTIDLTATRRERLKRNGYRLDAIVPDGETVVIDTTGNVSTGAETIELTDVLHGSWLRSAERAAASVDGLGVCGVDVLATSFDGPATAENHVICELNSWPGIVAHHFPDEGSPKDVGGAIVEQVVAMEPW